MPVLGNYRTCKKEDRCLSEIIDQLLKLWENTLFSPQIGNVDKNGSYILWLGGKRGDIVPWEQGLSLLGGGVPGARG